MFRVLLVDDEALALVALEHVFPWREYGFTKVITTTSSVQGLEILKEQKIDVAFVDIRMPEISGLDLLTRAQQEGLITRFVIVSGHSEFSYAQKAIRHNVLNYCLKPVAPEEAPEILENIKNQLISSHILHDGKYTGKLITDAAFCEKELNRLVKSANNAKSFTAIDIYSEDLLNVLKRADEFEPEEVLFFSDKNALTLFAADNDELNSFLEENKETSSLITDTCPASVSAFQNALKRVRTERQTLGSDIRGIVKFSPISAVMSDCFKSLLSFVESNYNKELSLQSLALKFGINYTYLSQQFKKSMGKSFSEYLTGLRLQEACRLLRDTQMRVVVIAEQVGYNDYHYFSNVFKQQFSMTPLQYRQSKGKD